MNLFKRLFPEPKWIVSGDVMLTPVTDEKLITAGVQYKVLHFPKVTVTIGKKIYTMPKGIASVLGNFSPASDTKESK